jgi:DUF1009 family protein
MLESKIQAKIIQYLRKHYGSKYEVLNITNVNKPGFPDLLILGEKHSFCIEVKQKGKKPRALQVFVMKQLEKKGIKCYVMDEFNARQIDRCFLPHCQHKN